MAVRPEARKTRRFSFSCEPNVVVLARPSTLGFHPSPYPHTFNHPKFLRTRSILVFLSLVTLPFRVFLVHYQPPSPKKLAYITASHRLLPLLTLLAAAMN